MFLCLLAVAGIACGHASGAATADASGQDSSVLDTGADTAACPSYWGGLDGTRCTSDGISCDYQEECFTVTATCNNGLWSVMMNTGPQRQCPAEPPCPRQYVGTYCPCQSYPYGLQCAYDCAHGGFTVRCSCNGWALVSLTTCPEAGVSEAGNGGSDASTDSNAPSDGAADGEN